MLTRTSSANSSKLMDSIDGDLSLVAFLEAGTSVVSSTAPEQPGKATISGKARLVAVMEVSGAGIDTIHGGDLSQPVLLDGSQVSGAFTLAGVAPDSGTVGMLKNFFFLWRGQGFM